MSGFSDIVMEHLHSPRNMGAIVAPQAVGRASFVGGAPQVTLFFRFQGDCVEQVTFQTSGCGATIAACSLLTEMIQGWTIDQCLKLTAEDLDRALGTMPLSKRFCPSLAVAAMHEAVMHFAIGNPPVVNASDKTSLANGDKSVRESTPG